MDLLCFQMLANEKRLHLVEFREENDNFPRLVASPESGRVRTKDEIGHDEILDFEIISFDGHMPNYKPEKPLFFERLPSYQVLADILTTLTWLDLVAEWRRL